MSEILIGLNLMIERNEEIGLIGRARQVAPNGTKVEKTGRTRRNELLGDDQAMLEYGNLLVGAAQRHILVATVLHVRRPQRRAHLLEFVQVALVLEWLRLAVVLAVEPGLVERILALFSRARLGRTHYAPRFGTSKHTELREKRYPCWPPPLIRP